MNSIRDALEDLFNALTQYPTATVAGKSNLKGCTFY